MRTRTRRSVPVVVSRWRHLFVVGLLSAATGGAQVFVTEAPSTARDARVWRFGDDGSWTVWAEGFSNLSGAVQDRDGGVYLADRTANAIYHVSSDSGTTALILTTWLPFALALDTNGDLFFCWIPLLHAL